MEEEIWKAIEGYEGIYEVSNIGRLKSLDKIRNHPHTGPSFHPGKILSRKSSNNTYTKINLFKEGISKSFPIHRLVANAFVPNSFNKPFVNHINGIKNDNRAINLEWATQSENIQHAFDNGLCKTGESHYNNKLTSVQIMAIRRLYSINPKFKRRAVARKLQVSHSTINSIVNKASWNHV